LGAPHLPFSGTGLRRRVNRRCHPDGAIPPYPPLFPAVVKTPSHLFPVRDFTHPQVKKGRGGPAPPPDPDRVPPTQGDLGGAPLPFSGTGLRRRLNSCYRPKRGSGGGPPVFHERVTPTPLSLQWEGGAPLGRDGGVGGMSPADECRVSPSLRLADGT